MICTTRPRSAAPDALLTYINYPPTEYLETPFFDVCAFNVFLHSEEELSAYLARLHHIAGPRPLLISEAGRRQPPQRRSRARRRSSACRCARPCAKARAVPSSSRGPTTGGVAGGAVDDWAFGLVDADRRPKPAYADRAGRLPSRRCDAGAPTPRVSVVVCAYNAAATIDECLDALEQRELSRTSRSSSSTTGRRIGPVLPRRAIRSVRVINTPNAGLSAARNVGLQHATGEIVAYTDADVRVDPEWLTYLVQPFADAGGRRRRRTGDRARRRPVVRAVRRACAGRADARPPRRSNRRARAGLQLRLPARRAARDRRVQSGVPARRRRRGRVLAYAGAGLERRVRAGGARVAPPSRHDTRATAGSRSATAKARPG